MAIIKCTSRPKRELPEAKSHIRSVDKIRVKRRSSGDYNTELPIPVEAAAFSKDETVRESAIREIQKEWGIHSEKWRDDQDKNWEDFARIFGGKF